MHACNAIVSRFITIADTQRNQIDFFQFQMAFSDGSKLIGVQVYVRHGARGGCFHTPNLVPKVDWESDEFTHDVEYTKICHKLCDLEGNDFNPNDPGYKEYVGNSKLRGLLTPKGHKEMYEYGKKLRECYVDNLQFISPTYNSQQVYFRSTNFPRTIRSLRCLVAGLFKESDDDQGDYLKEDPIKIHVSHMKDEIFIIRRLTCKFFRDLSLVPAIKTVKSLVEVREKAIKVLGKQSMGKELERNGVKIYRDFHQCLVRDDLLCRKYNDIEMKEEVVDILEDMNKIAVEEYSLLLYSDDTSEEIKYKAAAGLVLEYMATTLKQQSVEPGSVHPFIIISFHDEVLIWLLKALNLCDNEWPKFGADFILEMWETPESQHWVRAKYCGKVLVDLRFTEMLKLLQRYAISREEYAELCE